MTGLNIDDARCRALFASRLQQSDAPTAETVAKAIRATGGNSASVAAPA